MIKSGSLGTHGVDIPGKGQKRIVLSRMAGPFPECRSLYRVRFVTAQRLANQIVAAPDRTAIDQLLRPLID